MAKTHFLTARVGVAFVKGLQGDDPKYYRCHFNPEALRCTQRPRSQLATRLT